jgi:hypothetical protein
MTFLQNRNQQKAFAKQYQTPANQFKMEGLLTLNP